MAVQVGMGGQTLTEFAQTLSPASEDQVWAATPTTYHPIMEGH